MSRPASRSAEMGWQQHRLAHQPVTPAAGLSRLKPDTSPPEERPGVPFAEAILLEATAHVLTAVARWLPQRGHVAPSDFEALLLRDAMAEASPCLRRLLSTEMVEVVSEGITRTFIARMSSLPGAAVPGGEAARQ